MTIMLAAALSGGLLLEAQALRTWAHSLPVGPLQRMIVPLTSALSDWQKPLKLDAPRAMMLQAKANLAPAARSAAPSTGGAEPAPATASKARPPPADVHTLDIVLAGDSMMAVGLAPTLQRWLSPQENVRVVTAYRSGTGLARPEVFDWLKEYPLMLGDAKPALIICAIGANDAQSVQIGKVVLQFDTPAWDQFFQARLGAYLDMLTRTHARVLWLGMPEMRQAQFSKKIEHLNDLMRSTLARYPDATWLGTRIAVGDPHAGRFQQFRSQAGGRLIKIRADDGIHLTDDGALYLLDPIRAWAAHALVREGAALAQTAPGGVIRPAAGPQAPPLPTGDGETTLVPL